MQEPASPPAHQLRHTFATTLLRESAPLAAVQQLLTPNPLAAVIADVIAELTALAVTAERAQLAATTTEDAYYHAGQALAYRRAASSCAALTGKEPAQ